MDDSNGNERTSCTVDAWIVSDKWRTKGCGCSVDVSRQVIILYLLLKLCKEKEVSPECFFHVATTL